MGVPVTNSVAWQLYNVLYSFLYHQRVLEEQIRSVWQLYLIHFFIILRYCGDNVGLPDICTFIFCLPLTGAPSRKTHMTYLTPAPSSPIPRILCVARFDIVQWPNRRQDTTPNPGQSPNWRQEAARCHRLRHTTASPPRQMPPTLLCWRLHHGQVKPYKSNWFVTYTCM